MSSEKILKWGLTLSLVCQQSNISPHDISCNVIIPLAEEFVKRINKKTDRFCPVFIRQYKM